MKVSEYIPFYRLLFNFEYYIGVNEKLITVKELFEKEEYEEFELTEAHLDTLLLFDSASLVKVLRNDYFTPQNVVPYLRELLDDYRTNGGDPLEWLYVTFERVNMNPHNYRSDLITSIEKALIEWIEIFKKQPIDYLYYSTNPEALPPQLVVKQTPEQNEKLIIFNGNEIIEKIHSELKGYFTNKEAELLKALQGEPLNEYLLFPHNQNKLVEFFRRLKYNGFLLNDDTEIKNWICLTFKFTKKGHSEPQQFNENTVWDILNKGKGDPPKKGRICNVDWLPYKTPSQLMQERKNEKN